MKYRALVAGVAGALLLLGSSPATAGWVLEQTVKSPGDSGRQQILVQSNRIKSVNLGPDGRPTQAFIMDLGAETLTQIDYQARHYITSSLQEYTQAMAGAAQAAQTQMAESKRAMEQAMKNLPPDQRKAMEQAMRAQMPPGADGTPCVEPRREVRKTGQQATIAGYPAVRWEILADGKVESEVWLAPALSVGRELDAAKLERFSTTLAKGLGCGPGGRGAGVDPTWKLVGEGYPVRTVADQGAMTVEVVRAESRTVPAGEFQPPAGFARRSLADMMRR
jgi:hypothetical protein